MAVTNLAINPSFEASNGTVEVRRNLLGNPSLGVDTGWVVNPGGGVVTTTRETAGGPLAGVPWRKGAWTSASTGGSNRITLDDMTAAGTIAPGQVVTLSAWVWTNVARPMFLVADFNDSTGAYIGLASGNTNVVVSANTWTRLSVTGTAPANASRVIGFIQLGSDTAVGDAIGGTQALLEVAPSVGSYFDGSTAASGDFTYAWTGTVNASASVQNAPKVATIQAYFAGGDLIGYQSPSAAMLGTKGLRLQALRPSVFLYGTDGANGTSVTAGESVTVSYHVRPTVTRDFRAKVAYNVAGEGVGAWVTCPASVWTRVSVTHIVPAGATLLTAYFNSEILSTTGDIYDVDAFMIEKSPALSAYFDGDTPTTANGIYAWTGTPHASTSTYQFRGIRVESITELPVPRAGLTLEGLSAGEHTVNLWRFTDGERNVVRGGRKLTVADSYYLEDYEVPLGREVRYEAELVSGPDAGLQGLSATLQVDSACGYIQDPLDPGSAVPVYGVQEGGKPYLRSASFASLAYTTSTSRFQVMGSRLPVSISSGRQAPSGIPLALTVRASDENARLRDLVMECIHLVIRGLPEWGDFLPGSATYEASSIEEQPMDVMMGGTMTRWETTADQVRPTSRSVLIALWTYQDVAEIFAGATYDQKQVSAAEFTYLEDQKNPTNT